MNPINFTIAGQNADQIPSGLLFAVAIGFIIWVWSIVVVARTKTDDPFDRIVWLMIVIALNILGTILYFVFGMQNSKIGAQTTSSSEEEIKRRANEGTLV